MRLTNITFTFLIIAIFLVLNVEFFAQEPLSLRSPIPTATPTPAISPSWKSQNRTRKIVFVMDFDDMNMSDDTPVSAAGKQIANLLSNEFSRRGSFTVIERGEISKVIAEQNPSPKKHDRNFALKIGKLFDVDKVILGTINDYKIEKESFAGNANSNPVYTAKIQLTILLLDVGTGEIQSLVMARGSAEEKFGVSTGNTTVSAAGLNEEIRTRLFAPAAQSAISKAVYEIENEINTPAFMPNSRFENQVTNSVKGFSPSFDRNRFSEWVSSGFRQSRVLFVNENRVYIKTYLNNLKLGSQLVVSRVTKVDRDPATEKIIDYKAQEIARVEVLEIGEGGLIAKIISGSEIREGDIVEVPKTDDTTQTDTENISRYPDIDTKKEVQPAETFAVQISLMKIGKPGSSSILVQTGKDVQTNNSGVITTRLPKAEEWEIDVALSVADSDFLLVGTNFSRIILPKNGNSSIALFTLMAKDISQPEKRSRIIATFFHKGSFLAKVEREIVIKPAKSRSVIISPPNPIGGMTPTPDPKTTFDSESPKPPQTEENQPQSPAKKEGEDLSSGKENVDIHLEKTKPDMTVFIQTNVFPGQNQNSEIMITSPYFTGVRQEKFATPSDLSRYLTDKFRSFSNRSLRGTEEKKLVSDWLINWNWFYDTASTAQNQKSNFALPIDTKIAHLLGFLPDNHGNISDDFKRECSLPAFDLYRTRAMGLPTGQEAAKRILGVEERILKPEQINNLLPASLKYDMSKETPLFFYLLAEAEIEEHGQTLGEVGSRIIVETFVELIKLDEYSILGEEIFAPEPKFYNAGEEEFGMAQMLKFVRRIEDEQCFDALNPIGDKNPCEDQTREAIKDFISN